jgi:hypothetical protein
MKPSRTLPVVAARSDVLEMTEVGLDGRSGFAGHDGLGNGDVLNDALGDDAGNLARGTAHVEPQVVQDLRQGGEQAVAGADIDGLMEFDVEKPERHRIVFERAAVDGESHEPLPKLGAGMLRTEPNQFEIDDRSRRELLLHAVVGDRQHRVDRRDHSSRRKVRDGVAAALTTG